MDGQTATPQTGTTTQPNTQGSAGDGGPFFTIDPSSQNRGAEGTAAQAAGGTEGQAPVQTPGQADDGPGAADGQADGKQAAGKKFSYTKRNGESVEFEVSPDLLTPEGEIDGTRAALRAHDLRQKLAAKGIDPDAAPVAAPEKYTLNVPEELADRFELTEDDPELAALTPTLQKLGLSQEDFDELFQTQLKYRAEQVEAEQQLAAEDRQADLEMVAEQFGSPRAAAEAMNKQLGPWLANMMTGDEKTKALKYAALSAIGEVGAASLALWDVYQGVRGEGLRGPQPGAGAPGRMTEADLRSLIRSKAYHDSSDPEHEAIHARVRAGYQNLFKGNQ